MHLQSSFLSRLVLFKNNYLQGSYTYTEAQQKIQLCKTHSKLDLFSVSCEEWAAMNKHEKCMEDVSNYQLLPYKCPEISTIKKYL